MSSSISYVLVFRSSDWEADCYLSYKRMFAAGVKLIECHEYDLPCFSIILWVQLKLYLTAQPFLDAIFFAESSFPLLFTCSWPNSRTFLCLFTIQIGVLIGRFLKFGLFFDGCAALSTLSIRSFIQDLSSSSIFFSVRISFIMLLNPSASKETGPSGKFERKVI